MRACHTARMTTAHRLSPWPARLIGLVLVWSLSACSVLGLLYQQAPRWVGTWLNNQVQLSDAQRVWVEPALDEWLQWHRTQVLPLWVTTAQHWAQHAQRDWSADEVCAALDALRDQVKTTLDHSTPIWARLAVSLSPQQWRRLREQRAEAAQDFHDDFVAPSSERVLDERLARSVKNAERLYGKLSPAQVAWLRGQLQASPWSPRDTWVQRQARDQAMLRLISQLQAQALNPKQAQTQVQAWLDAQWSPEDAAASAQQAAFWRHSCATIAGLHRQASPQQRLQLAQQLRDYAQDFTQLLP